MAIMKMPSMFSKKKEEEKAPEPTPEEEWEKAPEVLKFFFQCAPIETKVSIMKAFAPAPEPTPA